jgi:hypothetical protein
MKTLDQQINCADRELTRRQSMKNVAVLFAASPSVYDDFPECDVYNFARDARTFPGGLPVVAHPPCRLFSKLSYFSTAPLSEKELAYVAIKMVRENGGVLEHPAYSKLWAEAGLPRPGAGSDAFGGWTFSLLQWWFGHPARKATWLYIVGTTTLPSFPLRLGEAQFQVGIRKGIKKGHPAWKPTIYGSRHNGASSATPSRFARWLIALAKSCRSPSLHGA